MILDVWGELAGHKRSLTHHTQISRLGIQCHNFYSYIFIFTFSKPLQLFNCLSHCGCTLFNFLSHCGCTLFNFLSHCGCTTLFTFSKPLKLYIFQVIEAGVFFVVILLYFLLLYFLLIVICYVYCCLSCLYCYLLVC